MILLSRFSSFYNFLKNDTYNTLLANHLITIYFFFISWSKDSLRTTFFLILLLFLIRGNYIIHIKNSLQNKVIQAFCLYFAIHVVSILFSQDINVSISSIDDMKYLLYPIIFYSYINSKYIQNYFFAFIAGMFMSEIFSYCISFQIFDFHFYEHSSPSNPTPFLHHVMYGLLMAFTASILLQEIILVKHQIKRYFLVFFLITLSFNIFLNAARSGFYLYLIAIFLTLLLIYKEKLLKAISIFFILSFTVLILAFSFSNVFKSKINQAKNEVTMLVEEKNFHSSWGNRIKMQIDSMQILYQNPMILITGIGAGQTMPTLREYAKLNPTDDMLETYIHTPGNHNQYLDSIIQFGLIGLLLFLNIIYQILKYNQKNKFLRIAQIVLAVLLIFYSLHENSLADHIIGIFFILMTTITLYDKNTIMIIPNFDFKTISKYISLVIIIFLIALVT